MGFLTQGIQKWKTNFIQFFNFFTEVKFDQLGLINGAFLVWGRIIVVTPQVFSQGLLFISRWRGINQHIVEIFNLKCNE